MGEGGGWGEREGGREGRVREREGGWDWGEREDRGGGRVGWGREGG